MANTSYKVEKVTIIEWINLDNSQVEQLHDYAFRVSEHLEEIGNPAIAKVMYDISDRLQRLKRISTKQLHMIAKGMRLSFNEILYVKGLEYWLIQERKAVEQKRKEYATKRRNGRGT